MRDISGYNHTASSNGTANALFPHVVVTLGNRVHAQYRNTAGDMLCRAPSSATTCAGSSPTGAQLTYDAERRLTSWQNAPTHSTSHAWFLYDREGHRDAARYTLYVTPHPSDQPA